MEPPHFSIRGSSGRQTPPAWWRPPRPDRQQHRPLLPASKSDLGGFGFSSSGKNRRSGGNPRGTGAPMAASVLAICREPAGRQALWCRKGRRLNSAVSTSRRTPGLEIQVHTASNNPAMDHFRNQPRPPRPRAPQANPGGMMTQNLRIRVSARYCSSGSG